VRSRGTREEEEGTDEIIAVDKIIAVRGTLSKILE
jgi:hypothetical protein